MHFVNLGSLSGQSVITKTNRRKQKYKQIRSLAEQTAAAPGDLGGVFPAAFAAGCLLLCEVWVRLLEKHTLQGVPSLSQGFSLSHVSGLHFLSQTLVQLLFVAEKTRKQNFL